MFRTAFLLPLALLAGCGVNGVSQTVAISTAPPGASCAVDRSGVRIGEVPVTPGAVQVARSPGDLTVTCVKPGYQTAVVSNTPVPVGGTFAYPSELSIGLASGAPAAAPYAASYAVRATPYAARRTGHASRQRYARRGYARTARLRRGYARAAYDAPVHGSPVYGTPVYGRPGYGQDIYRPLPGERPDPIAEHAARY